MRKLVYIYYPRDDMHMVVIDDGNDQPDRFEEEWGQLSGVDAGSQPATRLWAAFHQVGDDLEIERWYGESTHELKHGEGAIRIAENDGGSNGVIIHNQSWYDAIKVAFEEA